MTTSDSFPKLLDHDFFRRLVTQAHYDLWRNGALHRTDPLDTAQDVYIEIWLKWREGGLTTTDPGQLIRGLARTMVRRRAIDAARRLGVRPQQAVAHAEPRLAGTSVALDRYKAEITGITTLLRRMAARDKVREILDYVIQLEESGDVPARSYELLVLRMAEEHSYQEIGERFGEHPETLRSRLRRLRARIRRRFPTPD